MFCCCCFFVVIVVIGISAHALVTMFYFGYLGSGCLISIVHFHYKLLNLFLFLHIIPLPACWVPLNLLFS